MVEQALIAGDAVRRPRRGRGARRGEPLTRRLAGLLARVATAAGERDEARAWIARGAGAPGEPDWSDIDPAGRAFAYAAADWARDRPGLRRERRARSTPASSAASAASATCPSLPAAYVEVAAFVSAAESGDACPPIVDDGDFGDDPVARPQPAGATARPRRVRRRPRKGR